MDEVHLMISLMEPMELRQLANGLKKVKRTSFSIPGGFSPEVAPLPLVRTAVIKHLQKQYKLFRNALEDRYTDEIAMWKEKGLKFKDFTREIFFSGMKPEIAVAISIIIYPEEFVACDWIEENINKNRHPFDHNWDTQLDDNNAMNQWYKMLMNVETQKSLYSDLDCLVSQYCSQHSKTIQEIENIIGNWEWVECIRNWPRLIYQFHFQAVSVVFWKRFFKENNSRQQSDLPIALYALIGCMTSQEIRKLNRRTNRYRKVIQGHIEKNNRLNEKVEKIKTELDDKNKLVKQYIKEYHKILSENEQYKEQSLKVSPMVLPAEIEFSDRPSSYAFIIQEDSKLLQCFFRDYCVMDSKLDFQEIRNKLSRLENVEIVVINATGITQHNLNKIKNYLKKVNIECIVIRANTSIEVIRETITSVALL